MYRTRSIKTNDQEIEYIFLDDISIPIPPVMYKPRKGEVGWRRSTELKIGRFYVKMGFQKSSVVGGIDNYYRIPGSDFHVRPIITYDYTDDMRNAPITLKHEIVMYDGIFDAWSVPVRPEMILDLDDDKMDKSVILFNLDLFSGPVTFKWKEFSHIFEAYLTSA